jgi:hypothetical protein
VRSAQLEKDAESAAAAKEAAELRTWSLHWPFSSPPIRFAIPKLAHNLRERQQAEKQASNEVTGRWTAAWFGRTEFARMVMKRMDAVDFWKLRGRVCLRWRAAYWSLVLKDSFGRLGGAARDNRWMFRWCKDQYWLPMPTVPLWERPWLDQDAQPAEAKYGEYFACERVSHLLTELGPPGRVTGRLLVDRPGLKMLCRTCGSELVELEHTSSSSDRDLYPKVSHLTAPDRFRCPQLFCYWLQREALMHKWCFCMLTIDSNNSVTTKVGPVPCWRPRHLPVLLVDIVLRRSLVRRCGIREASLPTHQLVHNHGIFDPSYGSLLYRLGYPSPLWRNPNSWLQGEK